MTKMDEGQEIFLATEKGKILRFNVQDVPLQSLIDKLGKQRSRKPTGVKAIRLNKDDKVSSIAIRRGNYYNE